MTTSQPRYCVYRQAGAWCCEHRNAAGRVVVIRSSLPTIEAALAEVDAMRHAPVIVASMTRQPQPTTTSEGAAAA